MFSGTEDKRAQAMRFGAVESYATKELDEFENVAPVDHLMVTTSEQIPWALYLPIIASPGTVYPLTVSDVDLRIPYTPFLFGGLRIQAIIVAPRVIYKRMLKFAAFHKIGANVERYGLDVAGIGQAIHQTENNERQQCFLSKSIQRKRQDSRGYGRGNYVNSYRTKMVSDLRGKSAPRVQT